MTRPLGPYMRKIRKTGIENFGFSVEGIKRSRMLNKGCEDLEVEGIVLKVFIDNVRKAAQRCA